MNPKPKATAAQERLVRQSARALARSNLVTAFGHCSLRLDEYYMLVCAPKPMGHLDASHVGDVVHIHEALPAQVLGEVRMHQAIYKNRADVRGICRVFPPNVLALAAMGLAPKARHGFGSYFYPEVPMWSDPALIRNEEAALGVAHTLGQASAVIVSINGAVTVADSLEKATVLAWFLEDAARVELACQTSGRENHVIFNSQEQATHRATWVGSIAERKWQYLTHGDIETI
ncbi:MAG: class II aldolase/adducin family protein [Burkholderiaceae bacterium]